MLPSVREVLSARLEAWQAAERGRFALWLPVFMGTGILGYFSLRTEPAIWFGAGLALPAIVGFCRRVIARAAAMALAAAAIGFAAAQLATLRAMPATKLPNHAVIATGVVRAVETLPEGLRVTLEDTRLDGSASVARWLRIRLRKGDHPEVATGDTVSVRALLRPPPPPAYPGAWDLQREAWFSGWGGSGYALDPLQRLARSPPHRLDHAVQRLREVIAAHIAAVVPGAAGAVSITLLTGVTTGIPPPDREAFRASGLAHLLAVAGLHIGIVMAWALAFTRLVLAASEYASLHWPTKQLAALAALAAGAAYMLLTGMHVPIVRSFAMASLYTLAVLAGRRAISLRGLALAAAVLMFLEPEQVPDASFQLSFSAVLALIAGYEALRPALRTLRGNNSWPRRLALGLAALALTSALAGTASAPFGAYHFGRIQLYFVLANMLAVPVAALWVMPAGLIALLLLPFGLDGLAFKAMGWGAQILLSVAHTFASWPAAVLEVPHTPPWGLAITALGMAWLGLWRSRMRLAGVLLIAFGVMTPLLVRPPDLLVSDDARLIGLRVRDTVYLQRASGASRFTRDAWLEFWASRVTVPFPVEGSSTDGAVACQKNECVLRPLSEAKAALLVRQPSHADGCDLASVIVASEPARGLCPRPWPALVDRFTVWRNGATAIWLDRTHARLLTDRANRGDRPWVPGVPTPHTRAPPPLPPAQVDTVEGKK